MRWVPVLSLVSLLIAPQLSAQTDHSPASDTVHTNLVEAMKQDLRRLVKAEDAFIARYHTYTAMLPEAEFATKPERQVLVVAHRDKGYSATITSREAPGLTCGLFDGVGVAPSPVITKAREPACWHQLPSGVVVRD
jgi:hypothetical protein